MTSVSSIALFSTHHSQAAAFYRAIGIPLADEQHDDGPTHHACELRGVHFAIYPAESPGSAPDRRAGGSTFPGFYVESLDAVAADLSRLSAPILSDHEQMPWGCRVVFQDPDRRPIEINQRGHCPSN
jgi:Glyoxalase/Bleomycin resistance protein/Dioxygenase superfamily